MAMTNLSGERKTAVQWCVHSPGAVVVHQGKSMRRSLYLCIAALAFGAAVPAHALTINATFDSSINSDLSTGIYWSL